MDACERLMLFFRPIVLLFGVLLVIAPAFSTLAQRRESTDEPYVGYSQLPELNRRVASLEAQQLDHRVTVLETIQADIENHFFWANAGSAGTGLLIIEACIRLARRKANI